VELVDKKALITGITGFTPLDRSKKRKISIKSSGYYLTGQGMVHTLLSFFLKKAMKCTALYAGAVLSTQEE